MSDIASLTKLSFFKVGDYHYKTHEICDFRHYPRPHYCMGLTLRGKACFYREKDCVSLVPGDIIFVPVTSRYLSEWEGDPEIHYTSFHFSFEGYNLFTSKRDFPVQKIEGTDFARMRTLFETAYQNCGGDESEQLRALGAFYEVLSEVVPRLRYKDMQSRDNRVEKALEYIGMHYTLPVTVDELAEVCHMSTSHFYACFKNAVGMSPIEYKNSVCINRAMLRLVSEDKTIEEISEELGFESAAYFRKVFKRVTGKTPKEYRKSAGEK